MEGREVVPSKDKGKRTLFPLGAPGMVLNVGSTVNGRAESDGLRLLW